VYRSVVVTVRGPHPDPPVQRRRHLSRAGPVHDLAQAVVTEALRRISAVATDVTLSNVTCVDAETDRMRTLLSPWVGDFFPSCRIGYTKPDARAFHTVTDHFGTYPGRPIHIGDDWACDIVGAVEAGARAVWVSRGRRVPTESLLIDHGVLVADDLAAAASHIQHLSARSAT
jgi:FMN phosphatase YigB (HAD superfamily)